MVWYSLAFTVVMAWLYFRCRVSFASAEVQHGFRPDIVVALMWLLGLLSFEFSGTQIIDRAGDLIRLII